LSAIKRITRQKTSIFIAHRLSTVMDCDRIFVLSDGAVKEQGTHQELIADEGSMYAEMWQSQNRVIEDE